MQLDDLIEKDVSQISTEELEQYLHDLKRMRVVADKPKKVKTNKDKRVADLLSKLTPEQIAALLARAREED